MEYRLRKHFSKEPEKALREILINRGVEDIESFLKPSKECELNPYDLENIKEAADILLKHLRANSRICFVVD